MMEYHNQTQESRTVNKKQSKTRLFLENFLVYGLGGVISKIVPLIMLPVITRLMPDTAAFGISDLSNTIVSFGSAIAVLGMYDAMYRMFFDEDSENYKKSVCSTTMLFTLIMSIIVATVMAIFQRFIAKWFFGNAKYCYLVIITALTTLVSATNNIIQAPTRMQNKRKIYLITNTITSVLSYSVSIPLILSGHYIVALPFGALISGAALEMIFWILNHNWFSLRYFEKKLLKPLLTIAIPLFPNFLIYWVFNSSDKLMVTNIMSVGAAGVYSIGAKLGNASQLIYTAFAGGWQYFAFSTIREGDQVKSNSLIFEYLGVVSFVATSFICAWCYGLYRLFFTGDYVAGYIVAPYLFLAPLLQMLFQVAANQFIVIKKTWPNMLILLFGAFANILFNLLMIPRIGIEGAAIATLLGYCASDVICCIVLIRMNLMILSKRFVMCSFLMAIYFFVWRKIATTRILFGTLMAMAFTILMLWIYRDVIGKAVNKLRGRKY